MKRQLHAIVKPGLNWSVAISDGEDEYALLKKAPYDKN